MDLLFVPNYAIDTEEIFSRGGRNFGDEDFSLFKCPNCWQVYLIDQSADVVYVNPKDVNARVPAERLTARCVGCDSPITEAPLTGDAAPEAVRVTWDQLRATKWAWVATVEVMMRNKKAMQKRL